MGVKWVRLSENERGREGEGYRRRGEGLEGKE